MRRAKSTSRAASRSAAEHDKVRGRGFHVPVAAVVVVAVVLAVAGFALGRGVFSAASGRMERVDAPAISVSDARSTALSSPTDGAASASSGMVEVPELTGMRADEAKVVLETAGFKVAVVDVGDAVDAEASRVVESQQPARGTVLSVDSTVSISAPPLVGGNSSVTSVGDASGATKWVVCIDPGHQAHTDLKLEPIGPGSKTEKPAATGGTTGTATGAPEYEVALQIAMNLKRRLEAEGVKVVMTRTTNDVRLPNSARAKIANKAKADLFVRIHSGVSTDPAESGIATLYPAKNKWTAPIFVPSRSAARLIEQAACDATGATERGAEAQTGVSGFNWSKVPSVLVEVGYLSNPLEDRLMSSPVYQDKIAKGISRGILTYLTSDGN